MEFYTYNARSHILTVGTDLITGFADGTGISIAWESNRTADKAGIYGDVAVSELNDLRATATITLLSTANSNVALNRRAEFRLYGPFELRTVEGDLALFSPWCWVQKLPDVNVDAEVPNNAWEVRLSEAKIRMLPQPLPVAG